MAPMMSIASTSLQSCTGAGPKQLPYLRKGKLRKIDREVDEIAAKPALVGGKLPNGIVWQM
jgi:hypothetical protein